MAVLDAEVRRRALAAARALAREGVVRAAYVFGSHVEGRADRWSDIDVAAFMEGVESWDLWQRARVIVDVQKEVGFDVEPHFFAASCLRHAEPGSFAADVLRHGVRILPSEEEVSE
jgi:predicted nucleotidyltransferase